MTRNSILPTRATLGKLIGAAVVSTAAAFAPAQAAVLDFDEFYTLLAHGDVLEEDGFLLTTLSNAAGAGGGDFVGAVFDGTDPFSCTAVGACPVNNPSQYYAALNDGLVYLEKTDPTDHFYIKSFDASFVGNTATSYPGQAGLLRIQAFRADNSYVVQDFALAGPVGGSFQFGSFTAPTAFANTPFVAAYMFGFACSTSTCSAFSTDRGQFALDNLNVVPEPATGALFGLGLLGLGAFARRRKA
ncbi:MAG: NF038120 family PEP-CTERM protein [Telluria sp.]